MRWLKFLYLALGFLLLALIVHEMDLAQVARRTIQIGWGFALIVAIYFVYFSIDVATWLIASARVPLSLTWYTRYWRVRLAGEAFNAVVPAGGMGGEPVKAGLLKSRYGIGYRQAIATIVMAKTVNMMALVFFAGVGFAIMVRTADLPDAYKTAAGAGLVALMTVTGAFFAFQRLKLSSLTAGWMGRLPLLHRLEDWLHHIHDIEDQFVHFYARHRRRFAFAVGLGFLNWCVGVLEIYYALAFLGHPVSLADAWVIEAVAQLVRAGTFFIPSSIGAQDGALVLIIAALTGSPELGAAVALIRRLREILWIGAGFLQATAFSVFRNSAATAPGPPDE